MPMLSNNFVWENLLRLQGGCEIAICTNKADTNMGKVGSGPSFRLFYIWFEEGAEEKTSLFDAKTSETDAKAELENEGT
jgi:hypothetical protein